MKKTPFSEIARELGGLSVAALSKNRMRLNERMKKETGRCKERSKNCWIFGGVGAQQSTLEA